MKYFITEKQEEALGISATLYSLSRPIGVALEEDVTAYLLNVEQGRNGDWAIVVPETSFPIPLHPERDPTPLLTQFAAYITPEELAFFQSIEGVGLTLELLQIIPSALQAQFVTFEEMVASKWFSDKS
jgi:hypothetical protein